MIPMNPKLLQAVVLAAMFGGDPPPRADTPAADDDEDFHAHLKRCKQCADHPFALCVTGERLIHEAATAEPFERVRTGRAKPWEPEHQDFPRPKDKQT